MKTWMLFVLCLVSGCTTTVAPHVIEHKQASFDPVADNKGNYQNSGILYFTNFVYLGVTNRCAIITETAHARYLGLVEKFGDRLEPPLAARGRLLARSTNGLWAVPPLWAMNKARLADWAQLALYKDNPVLAPKPKQAFPEWLWVVGGVGLFITLVGLRLATRPKIQVENGKSPYAHR